MMASKYAQSKLCIGFGIVGLVDDDDYNLIISNHLASDMFLINNTNSYKEVCLETLNYSNDLQVRDAPPK